MQLVGPTQKGTVLESWSDTTLTVIPRTTINDGRAYLAAKATDNGDGTWHYEYALYNLDMDRSVGSFSVPVAPATSVTNIDFHAVKSQDEEGFSNDPWIITRTADFIVWETESFAANP